MNSYAPVRRATALLPLYSSDEMSRFALIDRTDEKNASHCDCCCGVMPGYTRRTSATSRVPIALAYASTIETIAGRGFTTTGGAVVTGTGAGTTGGDAETGGEATDVVCVVGLPCVAAAGSVGTIAATRGCVSLAGTLVSATVV